MNSFVDKKKIKKKFFNKNINIFAPDINYIKKNKNKINFSRENILISFHNHEIRKIKKYLSEFTLFHPSMGPNDFSSNFKLPKKLLISKKYFLELHKLNCKLYISTGAKYYGKDTQLKFLNQNYNKIFFITLNEVYEYERLLKFLPNALLISLMFIIKFKPKTLYLHGFNLHAFPNNISNKSHYKGFLEKKRNKNFFITNDQHNYYKTTSFLRKLYEKKIIIPDKNLKNILNFKFQRKKISFNLKKERDIKNLFLEIKNKKNLSQMNSYNLKLSQDFLDNKSTVLKLNDLITFNKAYKFFQTDYDKNLNYYKKIINTNFFDLEKSFKEGKRKELKFKLPNRFGFFKRFEKISGWHEFYSKSLQITKKLIFIKIHYNITVFSNGILLRLYKTENEYYDIPLLKGKNRDQYIYTNNAGSLKVKLINANIDDVALWNVNSFKVQYSFH